MTGRASLSSPTSGAGSTDESGSPVQSCVAKTAEIPKECAYLKKPFTVESSQTDFDRIRKPAKLSAAKEVKYKFPGDLAPQDALEYEVDVSGHKKKLVVPKVVPPGKSLPTAERLASAMGTLPSAQLAKVPQFVASPNPNPSDSYWATTYNMPNFSSAATGGSSGVTFYPQSNWSQEFTDSTMIHEAGHTFSASLWKDDAVKKAWENAIAKDGRSPSEYADKSASEDFSESMVMYSLSKGTTCEEPAKKLYPARYQTLDDLMGEKSK
jgi:hypothetical protein